MKFENTMALPIFEETFNLFMKNGNTVVVPMFLGGVIVVVLPILHFGVLYKHILLPDTFTSKLDVYFCSNTCWDTVFKVGYEKTPAGYKHVYFNVTANTMMIWIITVCAVITLYESTKHLFKLYWKNSLRLSMVLLFVCSIYSNYYTWWSYFNYINDDFYTQWMHQLMFSVSELLSSVIILYHCDSRTELKPRLVLMVVNIAAFHILASCWDQFVSNVVLQGGDIHQWTRDIGFMIPDILNIGIPLLLLYRLHNGHFCGLSYQEKNRSTILSPHDLLKLDDYVASIILVLGLLIFSIIC